MLELEEKTFELQRKDERIKEYEERITGLEKMLRESLTKKQVQRSPLRVHDLFRERTRPHSAHSRRMSLKYGPLIRGSVASVDAAARVKCRPCMYHLLNQPLTSRAAIES
jgi:hypothetical protein